MNSSLTGLRRRSSSGATGYRVVRYAHEPRSPRLRHRDKNHRSDTTAKPSLKRAAFAFGLLFKRVNANRPGGYPFYLQDLNRLCLVTISQYPFSWKQ